jgi:DMSO/TMAO reductase YedYZ heme-binding membrane subunit
MTKESIIIGILIYIALQLTSIAWSVRKMAMAKGKNNA